MKSIKIRLWCPDWDHFARATLLTFHFSTGILFHRVGNDEKKLLRLVLSIQVLFWTKYQLLFYFLSFEARLCCNSRRMGNCHPVGSHFMSELCGSQTSRHAWVWRKISPWCCWEYLVFGCKVAWLRRQNKSGKMFYFGRLVMFSLIHIRFSTMGEYSLVNFIH